MPWTTDPMGNRKYTLSIYAKEELPTWGEIYGEYYKRHRFYYEPGHEAFQMMDPYWRIPRLKVLLATICNQLNKEIFEDGRKDNAIKFINENIMDGVIDLRFTCELVEPWDFYRITSGETYDLNRLHEGYLANWSSFMNTNHVGSNNPPPVYTIPMPNGEPNPFILNRPNIERKDVSKIDDVLCVHPIILFKDPPLKSTDSKIYTPRPFDPLQDDDWMKIMKFMIDDVIVYFEGSGVGWKDRNGKLIDSSPTEKKCSSGYDPAL